MMKIEFQMFAKNTTCHLLTQMEMKEILFGQNSPTLLLEERRAQDVIRGSVKVPLGRAQNANSPLSAWECFFDDRIITQIIRLTNLRI